MRPSTSAITNLGITLSLSLAASFGLGACAGGELDGTAGDPDVEVTTGALGAGDICSPDLAFTVSASSVKQAGREAAKAYDGNLTTRWESNWADEQWLRFDLGERMTLGSVTLTWEAACGKNYNIETADNANGPWAVVAAVTNNTKTGTANPLTYNFTKTARYVRMHGLTRCMTAYGFSLYEMKVAAKVTSYNLDSDGDGVGGPVLYCGTIPTGIVSGATDCNDFDPNMKPGQTTYFFPGSRKQDGTKSWDYNCDGRLEQQSTSGAIYVCTSSVGGPKVSDCSKCVYNWVPIDASDCGQYRCSLQGTEEIKCR
jgi:hypothetical protein